MSALLMGRVWDIVLDHQEQAVMLALADHGEHDGTQIFPSVDRLVWKTGYSRRNVQYVLRRLEEKRLIIPVAHEHGGRGRATEYVMKIENGIPKPPFESKKGAKYDNDTLEDEKGAKYDSKRVQSETKGCKVEHKRVQPRAPQPSDNHHDNHHVEPARVRETSIDEKNGEPDPEPEADLSPGFAPPLPSFSEFQRLYRQKHGLGAKYSTIHRAYNDLLDDHQEATHGNP